MVLVHKEHLHFTGDLQVYTHLRIPGTLKQLLL